MAALLAVVWLAFHNAQPSVASLGAGAALIVLGITIRLATNATLRKNEVLVATGLYAACRHPMYVGTLIASVGIAAALNHPAALPLPMVALLVSLWRIRKEERFLLANLPGYSEYRRDVPVFPTPASVRRALSTRRQPLSLEQCFRNGEILRLNFYIGLLAAAAYYLRLPAALVAGSGTALVALAAFSFRRHPADARRSRSDYALPALLGVAIVTLAVVG